MLLKNSIKCKDGNKPVILLNMAVDMHNGRECEILISQYASRVAESGAVPLLMPSIEREDLMEDYLDLADGVLLIGGRDYHPRYYGEQPHEMTSLERMRPGFDIAFCKKVLERSLPVFGICAGCQLLNIVCGGKLIQHLENAQEHTGGTFHEATVMEEGLFSKIFRTNPGNSLTVNSFHHQALDERFIGASLKVTARAFDGSVEAVEGTGSQTVFAVQFHPERMEDLGPLFFRALTQEAAKLKK